MGASSVGSPRPTGCSAHGERSNGLRSRPASADAAQPIHPPRAPRRTSTGTGVARSQNHLGTAGKTGPEVPVHPPATPQHRLLQRLQVRLVPIYTMENCWSGLLACFGPSRGDCRGRCRRSPWSSLIAPYEKAVGFVDYFSSRILTASSTALARCSLIQS